MNRKEIKELIYEELKSMLTEVGQSRNIIAIGKAFERAIIEDLDNYGVTQFAQMLAQAFSEKIRMKLGTESNAKEFVNIFTKYLHDQV